jgi:hypothetical protein
MLHKRLPTESKRLVSPNPKKSWHPSEIFDRRGGEMSVVMVHQSY